MSKYKPFPKIDLPDRQWPDRMITEAPAWVSVDLRDGNQALAIPMSISNKLEMFRLLTRIGFKEIEVGFPSASQIDFDFIRYLIDNGEVPDDVTLQVLTQSRDHLIRRSFESLKGAKKAIVHLYNSTSPLQRKVTFGMSKEEILKIAEEGTKLVKELVSSLPETEVRLEYSPESFSDTEVEYALEVCEAVMNVWEPDEENKVILNLPHTVEWFTPNIYADKIEWICRNIKERDKAIISIHTHNDRGTGVAASELGMMAGAERVEGTLFGNGERTGNLDIVTMALNMYSQGVDPKLDFSNIASIRDIYENCTRMQVHERAPYSGDLVFTAFSGSHQDAIKKGMDKRNASEKTDVLWEVPYLPIDPKDIGRTYEAIIRINSQSGKGGVAYILSREFGFDLPKQMQPEIGKEINDLSDELGKELTPEEIYDLFQKRFIKNEHPLRLLSFKSETHDNGEEETACWAVVMFNHTKIPIQGKGIGPIDAFTNALKEKYTSDFKVTDFHEQALSSGSNAAAAAYIRLQLESGKEFWGVGVDKNISIAGVRALISAYNRAYDTV